MAEDQGLPVDFNQQIIAEFRANGGKVGGMFESMPLALLTTTGARSGRRHTTPLAYLEIDRQQVVIGSNGGADTNPAWYHNVLAKPGVTVEWGTETFEATTEVLRGDERDRVFTKVVEMAPGFGDYQKGTSRVIPVVVVNRR